METWCPQNIFDFFEGFEEAGELKSEPHIEFLRQIGEALIARRRSKQLNPNIQLLSGTFWEDVYRSLNGFRRHIFSKIFSCKNPELGIEYDVEKEEYAILNRSRAGMVDSWSTLSKWLAADFVWGDVRIVEKLDSYKKIIYPNRILRR